MTTRVVVDSNGQVTGAGPFPLTGLSAALELDGATATISAPQIVPVQSILSQRINVTLNEQACTILLYFKKIMVPDAAEIATDPPPFIAIQPLFMDLYTTDGNGVTSAVITGVLCQNNNLLVRDPYLGLIGDLAFVDTQERPEGGGADPQVDGLGTRWALTYWPLLP